jgi:hypothetical protein
VVALRQKTNQLERLGGAPQTTTNKVPPREQNANAIAAAPANQPTLGVDSSPYDAIHHLPHHQHLPHAAHPSNANERTSPPAEGLPNISFDSATDSIVHPPRLRATKAAHRGSGEL